MNKSKHWYSQIISLFLSVLVTLSSPQPGHGTSDTARQAEQSKLGASFIPGRLLVKFGSQVSRTRAQGLTAALGVRSDREISGTGIHIVELPEGADEEISMRALKAMPEVVFAELDRILQPDELIPDDPSYSSQWHLPKIAAPQTWPVTTGSSSITIAVIDTGVDSLHPDLAQKLAPGWNIYDNNSDTSDVQGHGTAVAGTAAAAGNNSIGVASVAWDCRIMPVRVSDGLGNASVSSIASGLVWAADHGARVANVSYAASNFSSVSSAAQYFQSKGGVVAISSGNNGSFDTTPDNPYVMTVGATTTTDALASWSNTGNNIDIVAPGTAILTTTLNGGYGSWSGTSFSAPVVAGVAALVLSVNPALSAEQVQNILKQSSDDLGNAGWDEGYGWGRVNAYSAVNRALGAGGSPDTTPPTISLISPQNNVEVSGHVFVEASASDNIGIESVSFKVDGQVIAVDREFPYSITWDSATSPSGTHVVTATASDSQGNTANASATVSVANAVANTPPEIVITSPVQDASVWGNITVYVNATDDVKVTRVELYVDGRLKDSSTRAPFKLRWNTSKAEPGEHTIYCKAYDQAGLEGISTAVRVYLGR